LREGWKVGLRDDGFEGKLVRRERIFIGNLDVKIKEVRAIDKRWLEIYA
jgi:hypothetical protein